jgi:tricorn protease
MVDVSSGKLTDIDHATENEFRSYSFSPDSRWVTYTKEGSNNNSAIWVYELSSGSIQQVTDGAYSDDSPVFSMCGNYIFFTSNRDYNITYSSFEFDFIFNNSARLYALALTQKSPKIIKDKDDLETVKSVNESDKQTISTSKKGSKGYVADTISSKKQVKVEIDFKGINNRIFALQGEAGDYQIVGPAGDGLVYLNKGKLMLYNLAEEKNEVILDMVLSATLSADGKMVMYKAVNDYGIIKLTPDQKEGAGKLNLDGLVMKLEPRKEWNQIFTDAWRIYRDYFYVDNLHHVDWLAMKERYSVLLPYISHRADLDYVLSELVSESNTGHSYVDWGDFQRVTRINNGLLGAELQADESTGRYKISKIYQGENWNPARRSPLTEQGVDVKEGDYLISIDGKDITTKDNPYYFLENKANKPVEIKVSNNSLANNSRTSLIVPTSSDQELLYFNWVNERRSMVDKLSNGRIGYIHVPNTAGEGSRELYKGMYTSFNKDALIIDERYNGGGSIPDRMADLLDRHTLAYWHMNGLQPAKTPAIANDGPKVMLINGYSSSGGDAFPYFFREMGIGKLIGTRTWGGLVGMSSNAGLVDGGYIAVPRFGIFDKDGWIIEGVGVSPDIEVVDRPEQLAAGKDPGVEKAVEVLLKELNEKPIIKVTEPHSPDRSKWHEGLK